MLAPGQLAADVAEEVARLRREQVGILLGPVFDIGVSGTIQDDPAPEQDLTVTNLGVTAGLAILI